MTEQKNTIRGYVLSDVGLVRKNNEDNYLLGHCLNENQELRNESQFCGRYGEWTCAGVFDGMGGAERGEVASYVAAQTFQEETLETAFWEMEEIPHYMEKIFKKANTAVLEARETHYTCGTTATVIVTNGEKMCLFHRGDSRAYIKRGNSLYLLSKDHTLAQMKLDTGIYRDRSEVKEREHHQLTDYIGLDEEYHVGKPFETSWISLDSGDRILICSDGLYDCCSNQEILENMARYEDIAETAKGLLERAKQAGGRDNITILLMRVD